MKTAFSVASLLACAFSLDAQIITTLNRLPDGMDEVRIRNNSAIGLVAFVVTVKQVPLSDAASNAPFVVYSDSLIEPARQPPLPASEERVVLMTGFRDPSGTRRRLLEEPMVTAGIFADGSTTGNAALLVRLMLRRNNMLMAVETALETLSDAGRRNVPRDRLVEQFTKMAESLNHWYVPPEQQVGRALYQSIAGKLMSLPEGQLGSPFPPSTFVEQESVPLRQRRVTLLASEPSLADATLIER
jgi:hypothetical protein